MRMIDAPSPRGTNFDGLKVPASWFAKPGGLALDAAPDIRNWKLGRDQDPRSHPYDKLNNGEITGGAADNAGLLKKIEAGDALDEQDLAALRKALGGEGTDEDPSSTWKGGPLGPQPPKPTEDGDIREFLKEKGLSEDDCDRVLGPREELAGPQGADVLPRNGQSNNEVTGGKMGGRIAHPIGMDQVLREAGRRLAPKRGDGMPSVSQFSEGPTAAIGMDAESVSEMDRMFGTDRIKHV